MKKILKRISLIITLILAFSINKYTVYAKTANISITSNKNTVEVGETVTVNITISTTDSNLGAWSFDISHDSKLKLTSGEEKIADVGDGSTTSKSYNLTYRTMSSGNSQISIGNIEIIDWNESTITPNVINNSTITINGPVINPGLKNGFIVENGNTYYYINGEKQKGIVTVDGKLYFFGEASYRMFKNQFVTAYDGKTYYPGEDGVLMEGFQEINGNTYYFAPEVKTGLQEINGKKYFFGEASYRMFKNQFVTAYDGKTYHPDKDGVIKEGFQEFDGNTYYFAPEVKTGLQEINGKKYFFGEASYRMFKNQFVTAYDGNTYYPGEDGVLQNGLIEKDGKLYFFGEVSYKMFKNQFVTALNGNTYYPGEDGALKKGVQIYNEKPYFFGEASYRMFKNQLVTAYDGNTYYPDENGILRKGIIEIDGKKYFFGETTYKMFKSRFVTALNGNTYYTNSEGIIQTGNQRIDNVDYVFDENGVLQSGYQTINGKTYYFYRDGSLAKGVVKIQGERNYFDFNTGELLNRNVKLIADVSYANGYINWDQLWSSGEIDGVILRVGYGTSVSDNPVIDSYFAYNIAAVQRLGIPYSVYLFGYAQTTGAATKEAQFTANWLRQYGATNLSMPIFYDAEISSWRGVNYDAALYSNVITTYASTLNSLGFGSVGVYGSYSWFAYSGGRLNSDAIKQYPLWVAQYYYKCSYLGAYGWQYTSDGSLPGINGRVDLSVFF